MVGSYPQNNRADAEKQHSCDNHCPSGTICVFTPHYFPPMKQATIQSIPLHILSSQQKHGLSWQVLEAR